MPVHDWSRIDAGIFHDFHQAWTIEIRNALNGGSLPSGFFALAEQIVSGPIPDVNPYVGKANRIVVKYGHDKVVAAIEIVSSSIKESLNSLRYFASKAVKFLRQEINLLIVDLFPPSTRDPQSIHKAIWDEIRDEPFELPRNKPLTVVAYSAMPTTAYIEPITVGDPLPSLPIFLTPGIYVPAPLEETYQTTWTKCPQIVRELVEKGKAEL